MRYPQRMDNLQPPSQNRPADEPEPLERRKIDMRKREEQMKAYLELRRTQARMKGVTP